MEEKKEQGKGYQVDLVIPVYKPTKEFQNTLKRIEAQTRKPDRIILINTEKKYFDPSCLEGISNVEVHHIKKEEFDHGGTRNQAAKLSSADIIIFMTQDAIPANQHMIEALLQPFEDEQVSVVYGRQMADAKKSPIEAYTRTFNYPTTSKKKTKEDLDTLGIKTFFCSNVCAAYRKKDYDQAGGFVTKTIFNEDMILASKFIEMGKAVYYCSDAKVWHWHDYSAMEQFHRNFDLAVSQQTYGGLFLKVKSESEGIRLVISTLKHLLRIGKWYLIPKLIWQSGWKFLGYRFGRAYEKLPKWLIKKCTMNPSYWEKIFQ